MPLFSPNYNVSSGANTKCDINKCRYCEKKYGCNNYLAYLEGLVISAPTPPTQDNDVIDALRKDVSGLNSSYELLKDQLNYVLCLINSTDEKNGASTEDMSVALTEVAVAPDVITDGDGIKYKARTNFFTGKTKYKRTK